MVIILIFFPSWMLKIQADLARRISQSPGERSWWNWLADAGNDVRRAPDDRGDRLGLREGLALQLVAEGVGVTNVACC